MADKYLNKKLKFGEILQVLNQEIDWHNEHKFLVSDVEHLAFIRGLVQSIYLMRKMVEALYGEAEE